MDDTARKYHADRLRAVADALEAFMTPLEAAARVHMIGTELELEHGKGGSLP